ncbi:MAG: hypothetical protein HYT93_02515 [Parcubacteria group bacterium]|nr:hypothetical protein [Parcubacteria group bacterium]
MKTREFVSMLLAPAVLFLIAYDAGPELPRAHGSCDRISPGQPLSLAHGVTSSCFKY